MCFKLNKMNDKNGKEITDKCYLRVRYSYGEEKQLQDGIYKVSLDNFRGITLRIVKIIKPEMTINTTLTWERGELREDYKNQNFNNLAVMDTTGENHIMRNTWKEQNYSNDIEVIDYSE